MISDLMRRSDSVANQRSKQDAFRALIRVYDSRANAGAAALIPAELADRLAGCSEALAPFRKRDLILTGIANLLEICERTPGQIVPELKLGAFKSRAQTSLGFRIPLELDDRLAKLLRALPRVSKRDVIVAALDLVIAQCETINGGPFSTNGTTK